MYMCNMCKCYCRLLTGLNPRNSTDQDTLVDSDGDEPGVGSVPLPCLARTWRSVDKIRTAAGGAGTARLLEGSDWLPRAARGRYAASDL